MSKIIVLDKNIAEVIKDIRAKIKKFRIAEHNDDNDTCLMFTVEEVAEIEKAKKIK